MKTLVVYYSLQGNTRLVAQLVAEAAGADLLELKPVEDVNPRGFMKYVRGGSQAIKGLVPELEPVTVDPQGYDRLIIGSPVWAGTFAPAVRAFFRNHPPGDRQTAVFCTHRGGQGRALEQMQEQLDRGRVIGAKGFSRVLRQDREKLAADIRSWIETFPV